MATRLLVCISAAGVTVALWKGGLGTCLRFDPDGAGEAEFALLLETLPGVPVLFMVDTVEEDYRLETLPRVRAADRTAMLDRKLRQTYRTSPFVSARLQRRKRVRGQRNDDQFLLAALTETSTVLPWIEIATRLRMPIVGVFAAPTVTPSAVGPLGLTGRAQLIVSRHAAGMRQTFLRDGQFRFSRLTPLRGTNDTSVGGSVGTGAEIINTRMYLNALQATTADEVVDVILLDQDDSLEPLQQTIAGAQVPVRTRRIGRQELARRLKIPLSAFEATPDALPLHLLGRSAPVENLAPAALREGYRIHQAGRWLMGAAAGVAAVGSAWILLDITAARRVEAETTALARETAELQATYAELTRQFPASPAPAQTLKLAVDAFEHLRERARTPEDLFAVVSRRLEGHSTLSLNSIGWRHSRAPDAGAAFATTSSPPVGEGTPRQFGLLSGEIKPFSGDYRTAVVTIREFSEDLKRDPRVAEVKIIKLPLDDSSRQALSGSTNARVEQQVGAQFEIAVVLREPGDAPR
jgi:hypothetical protein